MPRHCPLAFVPSTAMSKSDLDAIRARHARCKSFCWVTDTRPCDTTTVLAALDKANERVEDAYKDGRADGYYDGRADCEDCDDKL